MDNKIREPKQKRAIEKKERIIQSAYELFSEKGYNNTVTSDIAKNAGVSTGIVYDYFTDKRDILFKVLTIYINKTATPVMDYLNSLSSKIPLTDLFENVLDISVSMHRKNANLHNILHSVAYTDAEINERFLHLEKHITVCASQRFSELGYNADNLKEKIHIAMNVIQAFSHETTYDKHDYIDYSVMKTNVIKMLATVFE